MADVDKMGLEAAAEAWAKDAGPDMCTPAGRVALEWAFRDRLVAELQSLAAQCAPRGFHRWAELCARLSPVLGALEACHAEAADGNSPDLDKWPDYAAEDYMRAAGKVRTAEEARRWWLREYAGE